MWEWIMWIFIVSVSFRIFRYYFRRIFKGLFKEENTEKNDRYYD
jgi:hypothetical protein